jgi:FkbM family methyltransferase
MSQFGEHIIIEDYFKKNPPMYDIAVDVGAFGKRFSNTWNLISQGWYGFLIEPNIQRIPYIEEDFEGMDVMISNVAISDFDGVADFDIHAIEGHSSLNSNWKPENKRRATEKVNVRALDNILYENDIPYEFGLLSVDAEGEDEKIIKCLFDSLYRPEVIVVEATDFENPLRLFEINGYNLIGSTPDDKLTGNLIFSLA